MSLPVASSLYVVDAVRSPRGRGNDKGSLKSVTPVALLAGQFESLAARHGLDTSALADVVVGCVTQTGEQGANIGKLAALAAAWDDAAPAITINRYCASGLSAVQMAGHAALACDGIAVGAGVEMMSRVPMASDQGPLTHDFALQKQLQLVPIGLSADAVATLEGFSREDCDRYALASQQRANAAIAAGLFQSVVPVVNSGGAVVLGQDETPRAGATLESLGQLTPAFAAMGEKYGLNALLCKRYGLAAMAHVHHAGNSPAPADGASAVLLASQGALARHGLRPRAVIRGMANVSVDRTMALTGAVEATQRALAMAGVSAGQVDLFEVNESFAALMLHYMRHLKVPHEKLNVNGGAISLGHAMGSTGSALVGMAMDELDRRDQRLAVVAVCGAAGLASCIVIERLA